MLLVLEPLIGLYQSVQQLGFMRTGSRRLDDNVLVAPMADVTDQAFRKLCMSLGAKTAAQGMVASDHRLWDSKKLTHRMYHSGELEPKSVQIVGADRVMMHETARYKFDRGAQIIDITMAGDSSTWAHIVLSATPNSKR